MRIINNSIGKVKALAKGKGEIEQPQPFSQDNLITREHGEQQQPFQGDRIYQVTDGLKSNYTKRDYGYAFKQFLRDGAKTQDLQVLLDYKPKVIEQMVIGYVEMIRDYSKKAQLFQYRREMIQSLASKGHSEREIATKLQISQPTVHRDLSILKQKAKRNISKYIDEELPNEFHNYLLGLNLILQQTWKMSLDKLAERRERIPTMLLIKDCYAMKLDLLSSATVIDRAVKFVERHRGSMGQNDQGCLLEFQAGSSEISSVSSERIIRQS